MFKWLLSLLKSANEQVQTEIKKSRTQELEDLRVLAYHWGYVRCYTEHWSYPSMYSGEQGQQRMEIEAANLWTNNRNFPIAKLSIQAFIEEFCNGWRDALVKLRS